MGHKPFLVLSDHLTRNGIAVLRFDDRGVGESEGDFAQATSADFATDVHGAVAFLKSQSRINPKQIGLIGHSEGGLIAPMVAAENSDVAFAVLMAGPGISGGEILRLQTEDIARANGMSAEQISSELELLDTFLEILKTGTDVEKVKQELTQVLQSRFTKHPERLPEGVGAETYIESTLKQVTPWMLYFLKYDPIPALNAVKCPVLAINGSKDLQVASAVNLTAIKKAIESGGNLAVTTQELPGLNHLFQECETGSPSEYAQIEQTFSPVALKVISDWISKEMVK
jgi:pimeloyl-ACP methyl ester carboxylesterase